MSPREIVWEALSLAEECRYLRNRVPVLLASAEALEVGYGLDLQLKLKRLEYRIVALRVMLKEDLACDTLDLWSTQE